VRNVFPAWEKKPKTDRVLVSPDGHPISFAIGRFHVMSASLLVPLIVAIYGFANAVPGMTEAILRALQEAFEGKDLGGLAVTLSWLVASALSVGLASFWRAYVSFRNRKIPLEVARRVLAAYPVAEFRISLADLLMATSVQRLPQLTKAPRAFRQSKHLRRYLVYRYDTSLDWWPVHPGKLVIEVPVRYRSRKRIDVFVLEGGELVRPTRFDAARNANPDALDDAADAEPRSIDVLVPDSAPPGMAPGFAKAVVVVAFCVAVVSVGAARRSGRGRVGLTPLG
jgi:hypothetical protein